MPADSTLMNYSQVLGIGAFNLKKIIQYFLFYY